MRHWKPEYLRAFAEEHCPQKLFGMAVNMVQDLGMQYVALNIRIQIATQTPHLFLYSNYPQEWIERYQRDDLYKQDSAANASHGSTMPVLWTDDLYREAPQFRKAACQNGLRHGWTQSLHDQQHNESQISVARSKRSISITELYRKAGNVQWLSHKLHEVISAHHLTALCPPQPKISERELEVLKWSAAGKTAAEAARILSLSQSTINFHIRSVITKTNAANKAAAIAIAVMRGWI